MSTIIVSDSACDLPDAFVAQNPIVKLPLNIYLEGKKFEDRTTELERLAIYQKGSLNKNHEATTKPNTPEQAYRFFLNEIASQYDFAIGQTVSEAVSPNFENWIMAAGMIKRDYNQLGSAGGRMGSFGIRIINSGTVFAGQGILAAYSAKLVIDGVGNIQLRRDIEQFKQYIRTFAVPRDAVYLRDRALQQGDNSIGLLSSMVGRALDISPILRCYQDITEPVVKVRGRVAAVNRLFAYAVERINEGLKSPFVVISVAGDPTELNQYEQFNALKIVAKLKDVRVMTTVMNLSGGINLGPGAVSLALATNNETRDL